jgi:molybdenum cofactor cytidylyltransferase
MRARAIDVRQSIGRTLLTTIFRTGGKKLFPKGHVITEEEAKLIETEGMRQVWVIELEEDDVGEQEAAMEVARQIGNGSIEIRAAAGGRSNIFVTDACCVLVNSELLKDINYSPSIAVATVWNWTYATVGQRIATIKSTPLAVTKRQLDAVLSVAKERGPVLQARSMRSAAVAVLYCDPSDGERARQSFEKIMLQRLGRFAAGVSLTFRCAEREEDLSRALEHLFRAKPTLVLIASTTAPAGPDDAVGRAMVGAGCRIEKFLAPVEPGSLLLLAYKDEIPVVSAPGCFRSTRPNLVDLILPPLLAQCHISDKDIAGLGPVGLLTDP